MKLKSKHGGLAFVLGWALVALPLSAAGDATEAELLRRALDSKLTIEVRQEACRALQRVGTGQAAEGLGALLLEPEMHFMARYALEGIPDPAGARALQGALARTSEARFAIGIMHSLGERRAAEAVPAIEAKLRDNDPEVKHAAIRALGTIGSRESLRVLDSLDPEALLRSTWEESMLMAAARCALVDLRAAEAAFRRLLGGASAPARGAALVGLGNLGVLSTEEWRRALTAPEKPLREAAVALSAAGGRDRDTFIPAATVLAELSADVQRQLVSVLAMRGNRQALPAVRWALHAEDPGVRAAAARAVGELRDGESLDALLGIAFSDDEPGAGARVALGLLPNREVDERLMVRFQRSDGQERVWAIEVLVARGFVRLVEELMDPKLLESPSLLRATTNALRALCRADDFDRVLAFTLRLPSSLRSAMAAVLGHIARGADNPGKILRHCDQALRAADRETQVGLLPLYSVVQGTDAVAALAHWVTHEDRDVRAAAVQTLGRWDSAGSADLLLETAETHADQALRRLAIRSLVGILKRANAVSDRPLAVELTRRALAAAGAVEEKKLLLAALPAYKSAAARNLASEFLNDPDLNADARDALERMK